MYNERKIIYKKIEKERKSKVLAYVTGDRPNMETLIGSDVPDIFLEHLDIIGNVQKITLILYTCGGDTLAAWNIVNLLREFCKELEIIVPNKCRSAGTLMALGANAIVMTKQATLGPIDPSLTNGLSPILPNTNPPRRMPVSVESVEGYFQLLRDEFGVSGNKALSSTYNKLSEYIHPLVLGDVYRSKKQIRMLAEKLLKMGQYQSDNIDPIISFLCSDSGSHNYTINRTEARELGLKVESPSEKLYKELKDWYNDILSELMLKLPYDPIAEIGQNPQVSFCYKRALVESIHYGQDALETSGTLYKQVINQGVNLPPKTSLNTKDKKTGWIHHDD